MSYSILTDINTVRSTDRPDDLFALRCRLKEGAKMDIAGLSMNLAQTRLLSDVGTAVLSKSLEQAQDLSANMTEMLDAAAMELSVNPHIGANIDVMV